MNNPEKFNTPAGRFVQVEWDDDPRTLKIFLDEIGEDFFLDGWGYDNRLKSVYFTTKGNSPRKGNYIICAVDRKKGSDDRYLVNSISLNDFLKKL